MMNRTVPPFPTTQWSLISAASTSPEERARVLTRMCKIYWRPLYAYLRRQGAEPSKAEDQLQEFLADFISRRGWERASRDRGRFRTFVLTCLNNHRANEAARARAGKRDLSRTFALEGVEVELDPVDFAMDPELAYRRRWALALLESVESELRSEYELRGELEVYEALRTGLLGEAASYRVLGERLGRSEAAVKVAVHRLRHRFGARVRDRVADTVAEPAWVDDELRGLLAVLRA